MGIEKDIYRIINKSNVSVKRDSANRTIIRKSTSFKGLPASETKEIADIMDSECRSFAAKQAGGVTDWTEYVSKTKDLPYRIMHAAIGAKKKSAIPNAKEIVADVRDALANDFTGVGGMLDPSAYNYTTTNIWMSPWEANSLYSQKGLIEQIINKKGKSVLLNGLKIKNKMLTAQEIDKVSLNMVKHTIPFIMSDAIIQSLVYGGGLLFPMLKGDSPLSLSLPLSVLMKYGLLKKDCIDYIIPLDRWQVNHLPSTNPTQRDFLEPEKYFIPYLGCDVHGSRCSRIVTGRQVGLIGNLMTMGWGLPDAIGYAKEVLAYCATAATIPTMIQQMSIVARTMDISGALASEGINALDDVLKANAIKELQWSPTNPINLDMLGNISVINRNFQHVNELVLLERQDLCAKAGVPEPLIFSSTKGNFASGDDTQGNLAKQNETIKIMHKDLERAFKQFAKICVIDALGTEDRIIKALPYVEIHFDEPMVANSTERAEIGKNLSDMNFQLVASQVPSDIAMRLVSNFGGEEMTISSEILDELKERNKSADARSEEKHKLEMQLLEAQVKNAKEGGATTAPGVKIKKPEKKYSKLEQQQHSKTRLGGEKRQEQLAKNQV